MKICGCVAPFQPLPISVIEAAELWQNERIMLALSSVSDAIAGDVLSILHAIETSPERKPLTR